MVLSKMKIDPIILNKNIVVTCGASLIGANFQSDWLSKTSEPVVNIATLQGGTREPGMLEFLLAEHRQMGALSATPTDSQTGMVRKTYNICGWKEKHILELVYTVCALLDLLKHGPVGPYAEKFR